MGCSASTLDAEQSLTRCKNRKHAIQQAVTCRHAFAAAHAAYIHSLKNTGAAIRQFGEAEVTDIQIAEAPSIVSNHRYLPPPKPDFLAPSHAQSSRMARATSMPPLRPPPALGIPTPGQLSSPGVSPHAHVKNSHLQHTSLPALKSSSSSPNEPLTEQREAEDEEREDDELLRKETFDPADAKPPPPPPLATPPPKGYSWESLKMFPSTTGNEELSSKPITDKMEEKLQPSTIDDEPLSKEPEMHESSEQEISVSLENPTQGPHLTSKSKSDAPNLNLILKELDDQFLVAFESGKPVARLLEAQKIHYHYNLAGAAESLDHSKQVLRVMSWDRNRQLPLTNVEPIDNFKGKEKETHASTLDKLLAWEKKFHDEVKIDENVEHYVSVPPPAIPSY